jgi:hypothetical protein
MEAGSLLRLVSPLSSYYSLLSNYLFAHTYGGCSIALSIASSRETSSFKPLPRLFPPLPKPSILFPFLLQEAKQLEDINNDVFDGLTVMISACQPTKRGRPGFDSPSESPHSVYSLSSEYRYLLHPFGSQSLESNENVYKNHHL